MKPEQEDKPTTNWQWRPAARFDTGSVARFGDFEYGPYKFGILKSIKRDTGKEYVYVCDTSQEDNPFGHEQEPFKFCWIQYDAEELP